MILNTAARAAYAKAIALDTAIDARVIRADGSGTPTTAAEGAELKDESERAWADYREAKDEMAEDEMVNWEGPGWYASRQEWGRIRTWSLNVTGREDYDMADRAARSWNLGTPEWIGSYAGKQQ